ncbi:MAG: metallophosphatase family protein [Candidatus Thermoplasmatota archaeon]|nr:metallophosphatase family protein [Candidatus Thermoplasmatota archaeon]
MKLAIVADIHSNLQALKAVMGEIERAEIDQVVCAGDIVGYGANPNECCHIVGDAAAHAVLGNHEISALTKDATGMNPHAATASRWTASALGEGSRKLLGSLEIESKFEAGDMKIAMYHGSVGSATKYVFEDEINEDIVRSSGSGLLILGHTHVPYVKDFGSMMAINPGSVGQPRDGDPKASYAVLDTSRRSCLVRRVGYDIGGASDAILAAGLPRVLAERLFLGR